MAKKGSSRPVTFPTLDDLYRRKPQPKQGTGGQMTALERRINPPQPRKTGGK